MIFRTIFNISGLQRLDVLQQIKCQTASTAIHTTQEESKQMIGKQC